MAQNKELNKLSCYSYKPCAECGRIGRLLSIEGYLHHGGQLECLDVKECKKYRKKNAQANKKV